MPPHPQAKDLDSHQRDTLLQVFQHPTSHNIEWHDVLVLLRAVGNVEHRHDGKYSITIGSENLVMLPPKHKDVDVQQVVDIRRVLTDSGWDEIVKELEEMGKEV
ncbi:MAG TPA: hypothetical protein VEJ87_14005 [Acidimicrobiales bacterium]|nr:hypothetical protein [Acidimicrobiales bacterium]